MRQKRLPHETAIPGVCATCPVRRLALFQPLRGEEITTTQRCYRIDARCVEPGQAIYRQGDSSTEVYTLYDGWACLSQRTPEGGRQILEFLLPGDFFGFQHGPCGEERIHSAHAITAASVCVFTCGGLWEMFRGHIDLAMRLTSMTARDEALAHEHLVSLGRRSAKERIAHLLLELFQRVRARRPGLDPVNQIDFPLTQEHIADACGLTSIHVNRTLTALKNENLLAWKDKTLTIPDLDRLAAATSYSHFVAKRLIL